MSIHPVVRWAQRKQKIFIQIDLKDIKDQKLSITQSKVSFTGFSAGKEYAFAIQLFAQIQSEQTKWNKTGAGVTVVLQKKDVKKAYWPRLVKGNQKNGQIQIDWSKWIDEDDEEQEQDKANGALGMEEMQAMRGYPGMDQPDSDDDEEGHHGHSHDHHGHDHDHGHEHHDHSNCGGHHH